MNFNKLRISASFLALALFAFFILVSPVQAARAPAVSVTASDSSAAEAIADKGVFVIKKDSVTNAPLTVYFRISGTAENGADYASLPLSVTIPGPTPSVSINVVSIVEGSESVVVTLLSGSGYKLASQYSSTINILDNDSAPALPAPSGLTAS